MSRTIAIVNQKGGVGKSTSAVNISAGLHKQGYKVLAIDLDSQLCLTTTLQANTDGATILGVLLGEAAIDKAIQHTPEADVIAASRGLASADTLLTKTGKEYLLKEALEPVKKNYDFIIIDTSPALGVLTINALTAANSIIIPAKADTYSLDGINFLMETVEPVRKYCNPSLTIEGILFTLHNSRSTLSREVTELAQQIAQKLNTKVFNTTIRQAVAVGESQAAQQSLFTYDSSAKVTQDYKNLIEEILKD